ncbi:hypothetical protein SNEBB_004556 [Seison nebaliae]|nr:hypothetical protein SNEBB_004556 [Seison nebaliae]
MKLLTILSVSFAIIVVIHGKVTEDKSKKIDNSPTEKNLMGIEDVKKYMAEKDAKLKLMTNRKICGNRRKRHFFRCGNSPGAGGGGGGWDTATSQSFNAILLLLIPILVFFFQSH